MQFQYVASDIPTILKAPLDLMGSSATAQARGMSSRLVFVKDCGGSSYSDELECRPERGYWRSPTPSAHAARQNFSTRATSLSSEKTINTASNDNTFDERAKPRMSRSEALDASCRIDEKISNNPGGAHLRDCANLSPTELRRRYSAEANTHRNMLHRVKTQGRKVHPEFKVFKDFLAHVGPQPCARATLDRIDNADPEYAPGKVRWADKRTQNSNKGDTLLFYYSRTGDTYTVSHLAKIRNVKLSTIRKRKERGWTDDEIIEGRKQNARADLAFTPSSSKIARPPPRYISRPSDNGYRYSIAKDPVQRRWEQDAENARYAREVEGVEHCLADLETLNKVFAEAGISITSEQHFRRFASWWRYWKQHVVVANLDKWAQDYVARINAEKAQPRAKGQSTLGGPQC